MCFKRGPPYGVRSPGHMSDSKWSEFNSTHLGSDDTTAVQRSTCVVPAVPSHAALAPASRDPGGAMKPNRGLALSDSDTKIPCCRFLNADGFIKFVGTDPKGAFKCDMDSPANKKIYIDQVTFATKAHGRTARLVDLCQNHAIGSCPESESDCAGTQWRRRSLRRGLASAPSWAQPCSTQWSSSAGLRLYQARQRAFVHPVDGKTVDAGPGPGQKYSQV